MITYGQEKYIRESIEAILNQQCDYKLELIISDDCSPDNTQNIVEDIIKNHPKGHLIDYTRQSPNKGVIANFWWTLNRCSGEYIAICEGDDYWTDPFKLQKQIDFMESNMDCSMVFTGCTIKKASGDKKDILYNGLIKIDHYSYLKNQYYIATASMLLRGTVLSMPSEEWMNNSFAGDFILRYKCLILGKIGFINMVTCVYNKGVEGSWSKRHISRKMIIKEFSDNVKGLFYLDKYIHLDKDLKIVMIQRLRKYAYFKMASTKGKFSGFLYLLKNIRTVGVFYVGAYLKRALVG